jgi:cysteinyl-tRNA synthetase
MLKLYNSLTRKEEVFTPLVEGEVRLYVCGMTVYDLCHLGHARVMVVFDALVRYLRHLGYRVTYVRNITDIDDKIIARAQARRISIQELTAEYIAKMQEDEAALQVLPPNHSPRATDFIPEMQQMIDCLAEKDLAYRADNGDVYYRVAAFPHYGALSGKSLLELQAGQRVQINEAKENPLDFVLWKSSKSHEPAWDSPWGKGRPGWHIECSAMSKALLGNTFDIHGGGFDLQFPHHENEIAQSQGCTGHIPARVWMHNGFVRVNQEKMSKSLGNFFTIREILPKFSGEVIRFFILNAHYRSELNYSDAELQSSKQALDRLYNALREADFSQHPEKEAMPLTADHPHPEVQAFFQALDQDLNTPQAIAALFALAGAIYQSSGEKKTELASILQGLGQILGLLTQSPAAYFQGINAANGQLTAETIEHLLAERQVAKKARDFARADAIRNELKEKGVLIEDTPQGSRWQRL